MHLYVKKLIDQGWIYSETNWRIVGWSQYKRLGFKWTERKKFNKIKKGIEKHIIKITSFLPTNFSLVYRIRYLRSELTTSKIKCPVCDGYKKLRLNTSIKSGDLFFQLTCGKKDKKHLLFKKDKKALAFNSTSLSNHGSSNFSNKHLNQGNYNKLTKKFIEETFRDNNLFIDVPAFMDFIGCNASSVFKICRRLEVIYKRRHSIISIKEQELSDLIKNLKPTSIIVNNTRSIIKPKELDIYLPDQKLAVEYNGVMYHSHGISSWSIFNNPTPIPNRHLDKTKACSNLDIDLIHIFEDEYLNKQDEIEQLIRRKLNLEDWPEFTEEEVRWNLNQGKLPKQLQNDYKIIKTIPPRPNYFKFNYPELVSKWSQYKKDNELYDAGYRKYYDCGELVLRKIIKKTKDNK